MNPFCKHGVGTKFAEHGAKWRHAMPNRWAKLGKGSRISKRNTTFCRCGANLAQLSNIRKLLILPQQIECLSQRFGNRKTHYITLLIIKF